MNPFSSDDCGILRNMVTNVIVEEQCVEDVVNLTAKGEFSLEAFENEVLVNDARKHLCQLLRRTSSLHSLLPTQRKLQGAHLRKISKQSFLLVQGHHR